jgi:uncharacterized Zn-binding protein involved in type VI secretion
MSMLEAARMGDKVAHSNALVGFLTGLVVGAVIAVGLALLAGATIATGGGALILAGALLAGAGGGALKGMSLGARSKKGEGDPIKTGAARTFIGSDRKRAARAIVDEVTCHAGKHIAQGSETVFIEKNPAARRTDETECGGKIDEGWPTVFIGKEAATYLAIESEVPAWMVRAAQVALVVGTALGIVGGVIVAGVAVTVGGLIGGMAGGKVGSIVGGWVGEQIGGADGRAWGEALGEEVGGFFGGNLGSRVGARGKAVEIAATRSVLAGARSPTARAQGRPSALETRLARAPGSHPTQIAARQNVSRAYMERQQPYSPTSKYYSSRAEYNQQNNSKMAGTDFTRPVEVVNLPAGTKLYTYSDASATSPGGFLTARPEAPESIGIAANKGTTPKTLYETTLAQDTPALVSTASRKYDTFTNPTTNPDGSISGVADSVGGAQQINIITSSKPTTFQPGTNGQLTPVGTAATYSTGGVNTNMTIPGPLVYNRPVVTGDTAYRPTDPPGVGVGIGSGAGDLGGAIPTPGGGDPNDGDP